MFQRFVPSDLAPLITVAAFGVAASIYASVTWRAWRMRRSDADRLAQLPFSSATPDSCHESRRQP